MPHRRSILRLVPLLLSLLPSTALAQDVAAAEALFKKGLEDMRAGRHATACPAIHESYRIDPRPGTLFTLAECHAFAGNVATAIAYYEDYLRLFAGMAPEQQAAQRGRDKTAAKKRGELAREVPELTLVLPASAPKGTRVKRDGSDLSEVALGTALPVDPGEHVVATQAPGGPWIEERFTITRGEKRRIELTVRPAPVAAAPAPAVAPSGAVTPPGPGAVTPPGAVAPPPGAVPVWRPQLRAEDPSRGNPAPERGTSGYRVGAAITGGLGIAGVAVGAVTGALVLARKGTVDEHCNGDGDVRTCDRTGLDAAEQAQALGLASTIGFGVGVAGLATGITLLLAEPSRAKSAGNERGLRVGVTGRGDGVSANAWGVW